MVSDGGLHNTGKDESWVGEEAHTLTSADGQTEKVSPSKHSPHPWLIFGLRQSMGAELWGSGASDFNLQLNIQKWISFRQFHTFRALHEIWIRKKGEREGGKLGTSQTSSDGALMKNIADGQLETFWPLWMADVSHSLSLGTSLIRTPPVRHLSAVTVEFPNMPRFPLAVGSLFIGAAEERRVIQTKRGEPEMGKRSGWCWVHRASGGVMGRY